jgi:hypothetical protein
MTTQLSATASGRRSVGGCERPSGRQILWAIAFGASLIAATAILRYLNMPAAVRYLVPAVPLLCGLVYVRVLVDDIRRQRDELQLRIYLEAAVVVLCGLFIVMLIYPLLEAAHLVGPLNSFIVLDIITVLLLVGYFTARRRYR